MGMKGRKTVLREHMGRLDQEGLTLLIATRDGEVLFRSAGRGIAPLLEALERVSPTRLAGSLVVDRVVGKAGALLICYFKASEVYAGVMSRPAAEVLDRAGISFVAGELTEAIRGCPFERAVAGLTDPEEAYRRLRSLWAQLSSPAL